MTRRLIAALRLGAAATLLALPACQGEDADILADPAASEPAMGPEHFEAARTAAQTLGQTLKGELVAAMRAGGPSAAIHVCNERAPEIAQSISSAQELEVGRTSLRVRNPDNTPDAWERSQLDAFLGLIAEGADPATLEAVDLVETNGGTMVRWMKPIMMEDVCAACHGSEVDPDLLAEIQTLYPEDQATGFVPGELRGAFTVTLPYSAD